MSFLTPFAKVYICSSQKYADKERMKRKHNPDEAFSKRGGTSALPSRFSEFLSSKYSLSFFLFLCSK